MRVYNGLVTKLEENQVFVFGSNLQGFHGAGSAGFASFNEAGNVWRNKNYSDYPDGWKGKWNIKGVGWGFQEGTIGKSYAIPTVAKPGIRRSISLANIAKHVKVLYNFAKGMNHWHFLIAQEDKVGYSGYTPEEMAEVWFESAVIPKNIVFSEKFLKFL